MERTVGPFLTAEWRHLIMLNYEIDPAILQPFVPRGTELDFWNGTTYVSVVGFLFLHTRLLGVPIPFHSSFEEVNLRFYVRRQMPDGWRRAVVFIRELVPRLAIALTARWFYNENYSAVPMRHLIERDHSDIVRRVRYEWDFRGKKACLQFETEGESRPAEIGSAAEFITEHYWGYAKQRDGGTVEYEVEHPKWEVWTAGRSLFECDTEQLYGPMFTPVLKAKPDSAFLATGSPVTVYRGQRTEC